MNYKCNENSLGGCGKTKEIILVSLNSKKAINISCFSYGIYLKRSANYQQRLFGSFKKMRNANHMVSLKFCVVLMARKRPTEYCIKNVLKNCLKSYLLNMSINNDFFGFLLACIHKPERAGKKTDIEFVDRVIISV